MLSSIASDVSRLVIDVGNTNSGMLGQLREHDIKIAECSMRIGAIEKRGRK
jgi:hypothetical protein